MECFAKIVNGWKAFTIFPKQLTLDVWQGSEYASVVCPCNFSNTSLNMFKIVLSQVLAFSVRIV